MRTRRARALATVLVVPLMVLCLGSGVVGASSAELVLSHESMLSQSPPRPILVKVEGIVTSTYVTVPGEIQIDGFAIGVTVATVVSPAGTIPKVGDKVTVHALAEGTGFLARNIHILGDDQNYQATEFRGIITDLPVGGQSIEEEQGEEWGVSGLRVLITRDSTVVGHPVVGYYAHIQGFVEANGIVRATYVSVHDPAEAAASFQYQGIIRGITETIPGNWVIGSLVGMVTEATEIVGSPLLGALAEVGGHQTLDGTLLFDTVRIVDQDAYVRLSGTIDKVSLRRGIASLDGYLVVDGQNVLVDSRTLLDESGGRAAVGMHVDVVAQPLGAQNLIALRIRVTQPD